MKICRFNEQQLVEELAQIPPLQRAMFAAACAERLLPAYAAFADQTGFGDLPRLRTVLERVWRDLEGDTMGDEELRATLDLCMDSIPEEEDGWAPEQAAAEDYVEALAYTIRCRRTGDAQEAAWAARCPYEAADHFVIEHEGIDTNQAGAEERVLSHPLVQLELTRQRRDIEDLLTAGDTETTSIAARIRNRAKADAETFFKVE